MTVSPTTVQGILLKGIHADRPAATAVGEGTVYSCTTHSLIYQAVAGAWGTWATFTSGALPLRYTRWDGATTTVNPEPVVDTVIPNIAAVSVVLPSTMSIVVEYDAVLEKGNLGHFVRFTAYKDNVAMGEPSSSINWEYANHSGASQSTHGVWIARNVVAGTYAIDIRHVAAMGTSVSVFYRQALVITCAPEA